MTQPAETGELKTSLLLLAPLWLISILTGIVLTYSTFLGATLAIAVVAMLGYCLYRMSSAKKISIKTIETAFLLLLIPILGTASFMSSVYFPIATTTINVLLVSVVLPHLMMVLGTSKMNHFHLFFSAFLMLVVNPMGFYHTGKSLFPTILPFITITVFALVIMTNAIFALRDRVPVRVLKFASLALALICATASVYFYFYAFPCFVGSMIETIACTLLFLYLDLLRYQMRIPFASWTVETDTDAFAHVSIKICALLIVAMWTGLAPLLLLASNYILPKREGIEEETSEQMAVFIWGLVQIFVYVGFFAARRHGREKAALNSAPSSSNKRIAFAVIGTAGVLTINCATAFYYIFTSHPRSIPSILLLTLIGVLFLLLTNFLVDLRAILVPHNIKLMCACIGLGAYTLASLTYLVYTAPPQEMHETDLSKGNPAMGTVYNESMHQPALIKDILPKEKVLPTSVFLLEGSVGQEGTFEMIRYPVIRVVIVIFHLFALLTAHFIMAIFEETDREKKFGPLIRAPKSVRSVSSTASSVCTATTTVTFARDEEEGSEERRHRR